MLTLDVLEKMFKANKASDQQWIDWIKQSDPENEKAWSYRFFALALIVMLGSLTGAVFIQIEFIGLTFAALAIYFLGLAKLNNHRLYRIIQQLSEAQESPENQSR